MPGFQLGGLRVANSGAGAALAEIGLEPMHDVRAFQYGVTVNHEAGDLRSTGVLNELLFGPVCFPEFEVFDFIA